MKGVIWTFLAVLALGSTVRADTFPNATAIAALKNLSDLRVLDFYESLKSLYLSGGYATDGPFNSPIVTNENIPQVIWDQMRRVVNQTRQEIKNGDFSLKRIDAQIKLYDVEPLRREKWLSELAIETAKHSEYPKNLAFAIRDIGLFFVNNNLSRTDYGTGDSLQYNISTWLTSQSLSFKDTLTPLLTQIHHVIGPDHFDSLADVLEMLPYQVRGIWDQDADALGYYTENIAEQIVGNDMGTKLAKAFRNAFLNVTGMKEADKDNFLYRLSSYDVEKNTSVQALKSAIVGVEARVATVQKAAPYTRLNYSKQNLTDLVMKDKQTTTKMQDFLMISANLSEASPSIESLENIRMAMIAGARLAYNLGSIESVLNLWSLVPAARNADKDIKWLHRVDGALEIIKYLNRSSGDGRVGGAILLHAFLKEPNIRNQGLFLNSKGSDVGQMREMFQRVKDVNQKVLGEVATTIQSWAHKDLEYALDDISPRNRLDKIQNTFGGKSVTSAEEAVKVVDFLSSLKNATESTPSRLSPFCNYFKIISSKIVDYPTFIQSFADFIPLSRDGTWQDVWNALYSLSSTVFSTSNNFETVLAPLIYVTPLNPNMSLNNLREVFLSLQQLSFGAQHVVEAKVEFVKEFYGSMKLEEVADIVEGFDVDAKDIASKVDSSMYVDDFLDVLESSGSRENFGRLFGFHRTYTTNLEDANKSIELMNKMILFLHEELAKPTKSAVARKSFVNRSNLEKAVKVARKSEKNSDVAPNGLIDVE